MRIDAHQHFWRYNAADYGWIDEPMAALRRDFLPDDLAPLLARAGFDACVTVQVRQSLEETRWMLELADACPFVAGVVGWVDLAGDQVRDDLEAVAAHPKLVGVRHIVQSEPDDRFLLGAAFGRGVALLEEFDLAYDILIYPRQLPAAIEFVRRFEHQRFVLDHLAKPDIRSADIGKWAEDLRTLAASPHVCAKLSGLVTEADWRRWTPDDVRPVLDVALDAFGPSRLMVGSDWPVCTVAASYDRTMALVAEYVARLSQAERDLFLGGTAQGFWKLPDRGLTR